MKTLHRNGYHLCEVDFYTQELDEARDREESFNFYRRASWPYPVAVMSMTRTRYGYRAVGAGSTPPRVQTLDGCLYRLTDAWFPPIWPTCPQPKDLRRALCDRLNHIDLI